MVYSRFRRHAAYRASQNSVERRILATYLLKLPPGARPNLKENSNVEIVLPENKAKPPKNYNYLSRQGLDILKRTIRDRFIIELWTDLHRHGYIGRRRDELIYAWMEAHGIEITDTNWNSIAKSTSGNTRTISKGKPTKENQKIVTYVVELIPPILEEYVTLFLTLI